MIEDIYEEFVFHLRQGAPSGHTDIQSRVGQWILPWVTAAEISGGPRGSEKNLAFHIKIQDIAGGSLVLILEDFKAVCLQVEFQGRDANDLW